MRTISFVSSAAACAVLLAVAGQASAQQHETFFLAAPPAVELFDAQALEPLAPVTNAPFSADAITEFTQTLADGNRIERNFKTSLARDSRGRTRREQQIALIGSLAQLNGETPHMITISDPEAGVSYTLDERLKVAFKSPTFVQGGVRGERRIIVGRGGGAPDAGAVAGELVDHIEIVGAGGRGAVWNAAVPGPVVTATFEASAAAPATNVATQSLGTSQIEGVAAEGTRTTITIPAGTIGNVGPIDVVTERWFSKELQVPVQITRRDPRSGETVYRLTNIVRAEPPPELFVVPSNYQVQDMRKIEIEKVRNLREKAQQLQDTLKSAPAK